MEWSVQEDGSVQVRDGKLGDASPVLTFDTDEWAAFAAHLVSGT